MKSLRWILLVLLAALLPATAETVKSLPKPTGYVNDFAAAFTPAGQAELESICSELHAKTRAQLFVVTVHSLGDDTIETFANDLFHNWRIGEKKTDRGVLVLLAIDDHKRRIEVGYGLEGILPDGKVGEIGRDMVPALQQSNYDTAARIAVFQLSDAIAADSQVTLTTTVEKPPEIVPPPAVVSTPAPRQFDLGAAIGILFPLLLFGGLIALALFNRARRYGFGHYTPGSGFGPDGIDPNSRFNDTSSSNDVGFLESGSSSSSSSSDSSFSSSSDSGFSGGDGGDSGGGGASGDW